MINAERIAVAEAVAIEVLELLEQAYRESHMSAKATEARTLRERLQRMAIVVTSAAQ